MLLLYKIKFFLCFALLVLQFVGCKTIAVPLKGIPVGKPHAIGGNFGLRFTSGIALLPNVQGIVDEVKDPNGETINPIPGEPIFDSSGNQMTDFEGKPLEENQVSPYPVIDLAIGFAEKYEIGYNTARGAYLLYDIYKDKNWSLSVTPAYAMSSPEIKEKNLTISDSEIFVSEDEEAIAMEGRLDNFNTTVLGSLRLASDNSWFELAPYAGVGVNMFKVKIKDHRSLEVKRKESIAMTGLGGLFIRLWFIEFTSEAQITPIKNRDGKTQNVTSVYSSGGVSTFF